MASHRGQQGKDTKTKPIQTEHVVNPKFVLKEKQHQGQSCSDACGPNSWDYETAPRWQQLELARERAKFHLGWS